MHFIVFVIVTLTVGFKQNMNIMQNMLIKFSVNLLFLHIIAAEPDCFLCCLTCMSAVLLTAYSNCKN